MDKTSRGKIEFPEEVAELLSNQGDLESAERRDTRGVQKVDAEYEGDTYRIRTYPNDLEEDAQEYPARATIVQVEGDEEVRVGEAYGMDERELANKVYAGLTGEDSKPTQENIDPKDERESARDTTSYRETYELEDGTQVGKSGATSQIIEGDEPGAGMHEINPLPDGKYVGRLGGPQYILNGEGQIVSPPLHGVDFIDDGVYAVVYRNSRGGDETGLMREENLDESIHERMEEFRERDTEILDRPGDNRASAARIANRKAKVRATRDFINTTPGAITAARARAKAIDLFGGLFE